VIRKHYSDTATRKFNEAQLSALVIESVTDSLKDPDLTPAARATWQLSWVPMTMRRTALPLGAEYG
jgi:hypothetical protein